MWNMLKLAFIKYIGQLLIIVTVAGIALFAYSKWRDANEERRFTELIGTQTKYEQLTKYTAKLESNYKTQTDLSKLAEKTWKEVERKKDERIKLLSDATYLIGRHVEKQNGPDYYYETPRATRNYILNEIRLAGEKSPAIGYILIKNDGRTYKRNYRFEISVRTMHTVNEDTGHVSVFSKAFIIQREKSPLAKRLKGYDDWFNVEYPLEITGGTALIDPTMPNTRKKLHWWSPHINGGFNFGVGGDESFARPGISFSTSGYGRSRNDLDYKFLHFGLDTDTDFKKPGIHLIPFSYRPWEKVLTNTYIGPGIGWTEDGTNYFLNLNLSF